jgi:putative Holliday junction resolvase
LVFADFKDFMGKLPPIGKILAVDWGAARTGIAISDASREWSFPRPQISPDPARVAAIAAEEGAVGILLGLPHAGKTADRVMEFANALALQTEIPILMCDEHLTSAAAEDILHEAGVSCKNQKPFLDSVAALVILREFLERSENAG